MLRPENWHCSIGEDKRERERDTPEAVENNNWYFMIHYFNDYKGNQRNLSLSFVFEIGSNKARSSSFFSFQQDTGG